MSTVIQRTRRSDVLDRQRLTEVSSSGAASHYATLARSFTRWGGVDLVAVREDSVVFIEVKGTGHRQFELPAQPRFLVGASGTAISTTLLLLHRIQVPGQPAFPLRQTLTVTLNRNGVQVIASVTETMGTIKLEGRGVTTDDALEDLGRRLYQLVRENRQVPPHDRTEAQERVCAALEHLIDWKAYWRENPLQQPFWGRIEGATPDGICIHWLIGPGGMKDQMTVLRRRDAHPALFDLSPGDWFLASVREFPKRIDWVNEPRLVPDPNDPDAQRSAWEAIPVTPANEPGCWPLRADARGGA